MRIKSCKKEKKKEKERKGKSGQLFARGVQDIQLFGWMKVQEPVGVGQPHLLFTPGAPLRTKFSSLKVHKMLDGTYPPAQHCHR